MGKQGEVAEGGRADHGRRASPRPRPRGRDDRLPRKRWRRRSLDFRSCHRSSRSWTSSLERRRSSQGRWPGLRGDARSEPVRCWLARAGLGRIGRALPRHLECCAASASSAVTLTLPALGWTVAATRPTQVTRLARSALLAATAGLACLALLWLLAWMPLLDPRCLAICDANPLGVGVDFRAARTLANAWQGLTGRSAWGSPPGRCADWQQRQRQRAGNAGLCSLAALLVGIAGAGGVCR